MVVDDPLGPGAGPSDPAIPTAAEIRSGAYGGGTVLDANLINVAVDSAVQFATITGLTANQFFSVFITAEDLAQPTPNQMVDIAMAPDPGILEDQTSSKGIFKRLFGG